METEIILKKLKHIEEMLKELEHIFSSSFKEFANNKYAIGTAERYFQLVVDTASDINTQILIEKIRKTPDTYKQSFSYLARAKIITGGLAKNLVEGAKIRNILVHDYDFEEDYKLFYHSAKKLLPSFQEYLKAIIKYLGEEGNKI